MFGRQVEKRKRDATVKFGLLICLRTTNNGHLLSISLHLFLYFLHLGLLFGCVFIFSLYFLFNFAEEVGAVEYFSIVGGDVGYSAIMDGHFDRFAYAEHIACQFVPRCQFFHLFVVFTPREEPSRSGKSRAEHGHPALSLSCFFSLLF